MCFLLRFKLANVVCIVNSRLSCFVSAYEIVIARGRSPEAISCSSSGLLRRAAALLAMTIMEKRNAPPVFHFWQGAVLVAWLTVCRFRLKHNQPTLPG
jgi:hypothetical protein